MYIYVYTDVPHAHAYKKYDGIQVVHVSYVPCICIYKYIYRYISHILHTVYPYISTSMYRLVTLSAGESQRRLSPSWMLGFACESDFIIDTMFSLRSVHVCRIQRRHLCIHFHVNMSKQADTGWWKPTSLQRSAELPDGALLSREPFCPALQEHLNRVRAQPPPPPAATAGRVLSQAVPPFADVDPPAPVP